MANVVPWSVKRKSAFFVSIGVVAFILILIPIVLSIVSTKPTCSDGKENQGEFGVDCGGPCARLCSSQSLDPIIHWARALSVGSGVYNLAAYIENSNIDAQASPVPYTFKVYDKNNILIAERQGMTSIPAKKNFVVFEPAVQAGSRVPSRAVFSFDGEISWRKSSGLEPEIRVTNQNLETHNGFPHISAKLVNMTFTPINNFEVMIVVYDEDGNAKAASRTVVDRLSQNSSYIVDFTWPQMFSFTPAKIEIIPKLFPGLNY